ncbi:MAG TPA: MarR family transcriptional regulator [Casimicrobiaceae bacterium]|nr:MarR family transcriptional regulator [Casimicrobiaceae bacterium]
MSARPVAALRDPESRGHDAHHESLRLWLRLFTCALMIERIVRARLRAHFNTTLPRFDLMAQLERHPAGLRMGELSQRLMVTGGNVTGITDQLVREGLVERHAVPGDRRAYVVRLTARGKRQFDGMAAAHEAWIVELFDVMPVAERERLHGLLGRLKRGLREQDAGAGALANIKAAPSRRGRTTR